MFSSSVSVLNSNRLTYFNELQKAIAVRSVSISDDVSIIYCDSLIHLRENQKSYAFNNVRISNDEQRLTITGAELYDEGKNNYTVNVSFEEKNIIRVLKGPQFDYFSESRKKEFFSKEYKITNLTDRMGMRLEGKILKNIVSTNIRSEGITKGAIQVPADGQPIVLLTDHPTIGGYPKIANVISADYDLLVQKIPGTNISFKCIELQEAEKLYKEWCSNISKIVKNIKKIK